MRQPLIMISVGHLDLLVSVELCCIKLVQQYNGGHINVNARDTMLT
ncbi:hypothetical protein BTN49_2624 [Candidatus Enterovibrio escicola]|uniref:Uncharacterized protein n=1 Tax=Candidatus Enterovibrio escicola TaxID=1927127 RepID=A0A2A5T0W2_9GAMM|nr:hypothetical protein BTN49_2624 [Candidatus Enterovibrio escacola]